MEFDPELLKTLSEQQLLRFGIACCRRLGCANKDNRLAKALKKLEQSIGPRINERMRRDAYNAANSAYLDILNSRHDERSIDPAIACTVVCACGNPANLLGNFEAALSRAESLSVAEIRVIENEMFKRIKST